MALPSYWQQAWDEAEPRLREWAELWRNATVDTRVLRVGQLDAELLDEDLVQTLNEPLTKALNLLNVSFLATRSSECFSEDTCIAVILEIQVGARTHPAHSLDFVQVLSVGPRSNVRREASRSPLLCTQQKGVEASSYVL